MTPLGRVTPSQTPDPTSSTLRQSTNTIAGNQGGKCTSDFISTQGRNQARDLYLPRYNDWVFVSAIIFRRQGDGSAARQVEDIRVLFPRPEHLPLISL